MPTIARTRAALVAWLGSGVSVNVCLFTGSRRWPRPSVIHDVLGLLPSACVLRHGAARGADQQAATSWRLLGRTGLDEHPVTPQQWMNAPRLAGLLRNERMVWSSPAADCCVAFIFSASSGASHCADLAEDYGIPTFRFRLPEQE
jgi:hypothetical protein